MNRGSGERLLQLHRGSSPIILALESLGGIPPLLHRAEPGLYPLGELRAAHPGNALHRFLDAAVGPDAEADRALDHSRSKRWADATRLLPITVISATWK